MRHQVLVAGAGPTGLTLALDLARRGVAVRLIERSPHHPVGSRGDGIQPRTLEVFDDLGVLDAIRAAGTAPAPLLAHIDGEYVARRTMFEPVEPTPAIPYPNPFMLGQADTEAILRRRLAEFGVTVELGTALESFTQDSHGVTATLRHDDHTETVVTDYLVGADGGKSTVRRALGIPFEGSTDESIRMLLADIRMDALDHEYGYWLSTSTRPASGIMLSPLPGGRLFQCAAPPASTGQTDLATLQQAFDTYAAGMNLTVDELAWSTIWRPNVRLAQRFRDNRVFLAGDAAHAHPPTGGQGMNTGIQDAYNLGWKLGAALNGEPSALDSYEPERRTVAARVLGLSSALMDKMIDGDEDAMRRGPETQQLDISYRDRADTRPHAPGDRAPDAPLKDAGGQPIRLFDLLRGPHWTLLCFGTEDALPDGPSLHVHSVLPAGATATGTAVVDNHGHAIGAYHAEPGDRVLVRPDGYLAPLDQLNQLPMVSQPSTESTASPQKTTAR